MTRRRRRHYAGPFHPWRLLTMDDMAIFLRMPHLMYRSYRDADRTDFILMAAYEALRSCFDARGI